MKCNFSQFLLATMSPPVLLVSAPRTTPSFQITAQMVVPVLVTFGGLKPCWASMAFLLQFSKLNPAGGASIGIRVRGPSRLRLSEFVQISEFFNIYITDICQTSESFAKSVKLKKRKGWKQSFRI